MIPRRRLPVLFPIALLSVTHVTFAGGSLNPPGPPGPSMIALEELEPRSSVQDLRGTGGAGLAVTEDGRYVLRAGIPVTAGKHGILITATNVSLDLNGFEIRGAAGALDGIHIVGS